MSEGSTRLSVCACPSDALALATAPDGNAFAVLVSGDSFTLAFMTPFGPCARDYPCGEGDAFLASVAGQHAAAGATGAALWCADAERAEAVAASLGKAFVRVDAGRPAGGSRAPEEALAAFRLTPPPTGERAMAFAPVPEPDFRPGDALRARASREGDGWAVRWLRRDGADAGLHVLLDRKPTRDEEDTLRTCEGRVATATYVSLPHGGGRRVAQCLVIAVTPAFAAAFRDGRLPRHGGLGGEAA